MWLEVDDRNVALMHYLNTPLLSGFSPTEKLYGRGMKVLCKEKKPVKTIELSPIMTFFPLFENSAQDRDNKEVGLMSVIVYENSAVEALVLKQQSKCSK